MNRLRLLTALLASVCASAAFAQSHGPVEVSDAVQQDVLSSLRDVKPNPADYHKMKARAEHDIPLPHVPDNQRDGAVQGSGTQSIFAPSAGTNVLGVGNGFPGFTVQYAPPDTVGGDGLKSQIPRREICNHLILGSHSAARSDADEILGVKATEGRGVGTDLRLNAFLIQLLQGNDGIALEA